MMFNDDFSEACLPDGSKVSLTRSESRLASYMARHRGRVLSRDQLLDATSGSASEKNDRNIDFLINRLRRKLGDDARSPRFISTQYGQGYIWLENIEAATRIQNGAQLVVGPLRGLELLDEHRKFAHDLAVLLRRELAVHAPMDSKVVLDADFCPRKYAGHATLRFQVELLFFRTAAASECIVSAKRIPAGHVVQSHRLVIKDEPSAHAQLLAQAKALAPVLFAMAWNDDARQSARMIPLPVALHDAAGRESGRVSWPENDKRFKTLRAQYPDDPYFKLMYATHLHTKYVTMGRKLFLQEENRCKIDEAEIENLVLDALDFTRARPELAVMAAKLLFFVDQVKYRDLALDMANTAHSQTNAIASSFAIVGQLHAFLGDTETALDFLHQAERLSEQGSEFHVYILVLTCQALLAAGRRDELSDVRKQLYGARPISALFLEPLFCDPEAPSLRAKGTMLLLPRAEARATLRHLHYVSARLFTVPAHRQNTLRPTTGLVVRRFGVDAVPKEVLDDLPELLG